MSLTLYACDFCYWSEIVESELERLKLPFTKIPVGHFSDRPEEIERLTGQSLVPVLIDGEEAIWDSNRIIQHLRRKHSRESGLG